MESEEILALILAASALLTAIFAVCWIQRSNLSKRLPNLSYKFTTKYESIDDVFFTFLIEIENTGNSIAVIKESKLYLDGNEVDISLDEALERCLQNQADYKILFTRMLRRNMVLQVGQSQRIAAIKFLAPELSGVRGIQNSETRARIESQIMQPMSRMDGMINYTCINGCHKGCLSSAHEFDSIEKRHHHNKNKTRIIVTGSESVYI